MLAKCSQFCISLHIESIMKSLKSYVYIILVLHSLLAKKNREIALFSFSNRIRKGEEVLI